MRAKYIKLYHNKVVSRQTYTVLIKMHITFLLILSIKRATERWAKGHKVALGPLVAHPCYRV